MRSRSGWRHWRRRSSTSSKKGVADMSRSCEARLRALEKRMARVQPGERLWPIWHGNMCRSHPIAEWLWDTEFGCPARLPEWYIQGLHQDSTERRDEMQAWRDRRAKTWQNTFWSSRRDPGSMEVRYQHQEDPDVPAEAEAERLAGYLLACVPPPAFDWAWGLWMDIARCEHLVGHNSPRGSILAYQLVLFKDRACYWRRRLGPQKLDQIPYPSWASQARRGGHGG